jgi:Protein of unknown function (DUF2975)
MQRSVRVLDWLMTLSLGGLWVGTVILIPIGGLVLTGRGSPTVHSTLDAPFAVELPDGRRIEVSDGAAATYVNFPEGEEHHYLADAPEVSADVSIDRADTDARVVYVASLAALLGLMWFAWVNLQRVVRTARQGRPFDPRNPVRLRCVAAVALAVPVLTELVARAFDAVMETDPPVQAALPGPSVWFSLVVGFGLLALSQVFAEGARLRELEQLTV